MEKPTTHSVMALNVYKTITLI